MDLKGNVIILTGASSGIGRHLALVLAEQGARLVLAARSQDSLAEVAAACRALGAETLVVPTDVAEEEDCRHLVEETVAHFGGIDTLVNNAGISMWCTFDKVEDLSAMERIMRVNYFGSVYCTYHALPHLTKSHGRIVAISSLAGKTGVPTRTFYAASKHAMMGFYDSLRIELMGTGVSVTSICPGFVSTGVRKLALGADGKPAGASHIRENEVMTPQTCARIILRAMVARKREVVMTARGKVGMYLKLLAPGMVDNIARKAIDQGR